MALAAIRLVGARVLAVARTQSDLESLVAEATATCSDAAQRLVTMRCNLCDSDAAPKVVNRAIALWRQLDVVIANAG